MDCKRECEYYEDVAGLVTCGYCRLYSSASPIVIKRGGENSEWHLCLRECELIERIEQRSW